MLKTNKNKKHLKAFSLIEILTVLVISAVIGLAMIPVFSKKITGNTDINSLKCVKVESASNLSSSACLESINNSVKEISNATKELIYMANNGKTATEKTAARKVLSAACNKGGERACEYIVDSCKKDSSLCDIASSNDDLNYFLALTADSNSLSRNNIVKYAGTLFKGENTTIKSQINNICCHPDFNFACMAKGLTSCPIQNFYNSTSYSTYADPTYLPFMDITTDRMGNIYVCGAVIGVSAKYISVIKLDSLGNIIWQKFVTDSVCTQIIPTAIAVDTDGCVYVSGYTNTSGNTDMTLIKLASDGSLLWANRWYAIASQIDHIKDIAIDKYGGVYLTGDSGSGYASAQEIIVTKFDRNGNNLWLKHYDGGNSNDDYGFGITIDYLGYLFITGYSYNSSGNQDIVLLKLNSSGVIQWAKRYNSSTAANDYGKAIVTDYAGNLYIKATTSTTTGGIAILKIDNAGTILWQKVFDNTATEYTIGKGIEVTNNGYIYYTTRTGTSGNYNILTMKLTTDGTILWERSDDTTYGNDDQGFSVTVDKNGNPYIAGYGTLAAGHRPVILKMKKDQDSNVSLTTSAVTFTASTATFTDTTSAYATTATYTPSATTVTVSDAVHTVSNPYFDFK